MSNNFKPIIRALDIGVKSGQSLALSTMFEYLDLDGDPLRQIRVTDLGNNPQSGYFTYRGQRLNPNQTYTFTANEMKYVRYFGGLVPGQELFRLQAFDGRFWSDGSSATVSTLAPNTKPNTTWVKQFNGVASEEYAVRNILRADDPDGDEIKRFRIRYQGQSTAKLYLNGQEVGVGDWIFVTPEELQNVTLKTNDFKHPSRTVKLTAGSYDGFEWSDSAQITYRIAGNKRRPVIQTFNPEIEVGTSIAIKNFFNITDADGNTIKKLSVFDTGIKADGGFFTVDGVRQQARKAFIVDYADLGKVRYHAAKFSDSERIKLRAYDGRNWSKNVSTKVTTVEVPVIEFDDTIVMTNLQEVRLASMFRQIDDGPRVRKYRIYDANTDNRSARLYDANGNRMAQGEVIELTQAEFNQITVKGGKPENRWHDQIMIRAFNGKKWSDWDRSDVFTESVYIDSLIWSSEQLSWDPLQRPEQPVELTYTFLQVVPGYYLPGDQERTGFAPFDEEQRVAARRALQAFANVSGLSFRETAQEIELGDLTFANYTNDGDFNVLAHAYIPTRTLFPQPKWGDVWVDRPDVANDDLGNGDLGFAVLLHELGHAFGFQHPFLAGGIEFPYLPETLDNIRNTVMTYQFNTASGFPDWNDVMPHTPMIYDIAAIQALYGKNMNYNKYATTYSWELNERFAMGLWDAGGVDTIDMSNQVRVQKIDLRQGRYSSLGRLRDNVGIAFGVDIENAIGGFNNDALFGNELKNRLVGNDGNDRITGFGGNDILEGGAGDDTYFYEVGDNNDTIRELGGGGTDILRIRVPRSIYNQFSDRPYETALKFRKQGDNLQIVLTMGGEEGRGTITIVDQGIEASSVETLRLVHEDKLAEVDVDLRSIHTLATNRFRHFEVTEFKTDFGNIAQPV